MKVVVQRVSQASVHIQGKMKSSIATGLLLLVCIEKNDSKDLLKKAAERILAMRIFEDDSQKMNLSIKDIQGQILSVSQFTLAADMKKGNRPSFENAERPEVAKELIEEFSQCLRDSKLDVQEGEFGAMMEVQLVNDGPVTFVLNF